ncbi:GAF domain-containing protein [Enterococcus sp. 669A]|uniref:GAF domain-containing protein n=1 Tax=Candidatus Enterococcus moelleringii TaxID=2815325 RepID=A0ABS3L693_9ENTE|nr:GAF domain-containing protein [Enterococcus sp. 669A]MBO1305144.1 GAF domain-containing protein [Enterococcus sp. 669A]
MGSINDWLAEYQQRWGCDFFGVAMNAAPEDAPKEIRWLHVVGNNSEAYKNIRLQVGRGIAGMVWKTARMQLDEHIFDRPERLIEYPIARTEKLQTALAAPVMDQVEVQAVLMSGYRSAHQYTLDERQQLEQAAAELSQLLRK